MRLDFLTHKAADPIPASHILRLVPEAGSHPSICVHVRLFASYREAAGTRQLDVPLPPGACVRDLLGALAPQLPVLSRAKGMVALNQVYVDADAALNDGDEVALIPPVSGGA